MASNGKITRRGGNGMACAYSRLLVHLDAARISEARGYTRESAMNNNYRAGRGGGIKTERKRQLQEGGSKDSLQN